MFCIQTDPSHSSLSLKLRIRKDNWHIVLNADALSHRPSDHHFKLFEGWKFQKELRFVHVGVPIAMHVPNQDIEKPANCQGSVGDPCATLIQQDVDANLKVIIGWKKASEKKAIVGQCAASELCCKDLVVTMEPAALLEWCTLPQMGK